MIRGIRYIIFRLLVLLTQQDAINKLGIMNRQFLYPEQESSLDAMQSCDKRPKAHRKQIYQVS